MTKVGCRDVKRFLCESLGKNTGLVGVLAVGHHLAGSEKNLEVEPE